ncbi:hypothetical protein HPB52_019458 [Rhipicephalus sanguineus]|uniref:Gag-like protein n=1 Tax=Rhipicephalus sanguineus TaxID=34632 RepID=A0A9D4SZS7_RHISA|nr:hypothetical protein HPB52_019458 [Rhipicephalus sanguineus]
MASSRGLHQISPAGPESPAVPSTSDTPRSQFSDDGDSFLAGIPEPETQGAPSSSATRPVPSTEQGTDGRHIPAAHAVRDAGQDEDAQSSVSDATAVLAGLRTDPGTRAQARARELEDEISRFCSDTTNRITVSARNYILTRVFELVGATRGGAPRDRGPPKRVMVAERPAVRDLLAGVPAARPHDYAGLATSGGNLAAGPGGGVPTASGPPGGLSYAAALGSGARPGASVTAPPGFFGPGNVVGPGAPSRQDHVAFLTPVGATDAPARDVLRLLKTNIDPVAKDIRGVTLRNTRVVELVELCSDLRANAASERGAVLALKDQLTETRRENSALHQRAILAESRSCLLPPVPATDDAATAAFLPTPLGRPAALLPTSGPGLPGTSAPALPPGFHEHVAFVTPLAPTTTPARDTLRLIKANIDPVEKDIRDVMLRHTRKRNPHVRFSGVDPDVPPDDFPARLAERNPQLQLDINACKVRTSLRERSGTQAIFVEVNPQAFARILEQPRLSVGWTPIRAVEDLHVPTCTFCAQYGHGEARVICGMMRHAQCARVVAQRATWAQTVRSAWVTPPLPAPSAAARDWRPPAILQAIPTVRS